MLRYYFYLGLFVNSLCFFNLNAETIDQELQLAAAQCNVEEAQSLLDKGANPLASMTPESANSFDMVMTSMGMAAKSNNIELYQDCLRLAEIIRGEINSKNYPVKIIKIVHVEEGPKNSTEEKAAAFEFGDHKIELETQFSYTYLDGEDTNTSNLSVGGVAVHTYGPWKNTLSVDLDYENSDENGKEKSHLISLETRRKILQDKYTMFALVKSLKNTDESESKSMIVGIGRDFHDLFGTGIDGEINLGAGPTRISDSLGQTTKDNVIYSGVKGSRKIGGIVINGEFTDETGLEESTRSSTFKLAAQYCLDTGCNIKIGPAYKRNAVKSGSGEQSRDITYTLELSAKFK